VKPARFSYARPQSLSEALRMLADHGPDAAILAGGQSLIPMLNLRFARPAQIIDIKRVPGLDRIGVDKDRLVIGALARHADVLTSPVVRDHAPLIQKALRHVAHAAIRNRGTLGGSLALADPAAELPACVVCLEAGIVVASAQGERRIPAGDFFQGIYATAIRDGEMIVRVEIPVTGEAWVWDFDEVSRRHGDFAMAGLAFGVRKIEDRIAECRIVFCGVEAAPRRMRDVEELIVGGQREATLRTLSDTLQPLESADYPPSYRAHLAGVLLRRALARQGIAT
jgi:carbon-monoxide dehydrogenase medium subunit